MGFQIVAERQGVSFKSSVTRRLFFSIMCLCHMTFFGFELQVPRFKSLLTLRLGTLVVLNSAFFYLIKKNTP